MTTVVEVKGENQHPIYQWLTKKSLNGQGDYKISWNFNKFLIDENGNLLAHFPSKVKPFDEQIIQHLQ
jgi:glutathione peroxidase